ncbi:MAG: dihydrofolate reductase [Bacteroidales bacterium]|jgi:dihydrofolate reductase|nr:dihydrofolate reductase [Bacteroidales bacterium]
MKISIIVAITDDFAIGKDNDLLLNIPGDLKHFKNVTKGHTVIMGDRTFISLPNGALPKRRNIVLTLDKDYVAPGCEMAYSIEDVKEMCQDEEEVFIIGGGTIYKLFYPLADQLYLTIAHTKVEADTFFPTVNYDEWNETSREDIPAGDKCDFGFSFVNFERK